MSFTFPEYLSEEKRKETRISREGDVFDYLKMNLPENFIVVYEPRVISKRKFDSKPDFVIFGEKIGCVVLEVKNWNLNQEITKSDPYKQVQTHTYSLQDHLVRYPKASYMQTTGKNAGKLKFEVHPLVCMLGTEIKDKKDVAKRLQMDESWFITEEELKNKDLLFNAIKNVPKRFKGNLSFDTLMDAAKTLINTATKEKLEDSKMKNIKELTKIDKYNQFKGDLLNVSRMLISEKIIDPESNYARDIEKLIEELKSDEFKIGMFGVIAAGKSTILNALMGENFLKQGMGETSKVITYIRKSDAENTEGSMMVEYKTVEEISTEIASILSENMMIQTEDVEMFRQNASKDWDIRELNVRTKLEDLIEKHSSENDSSNQKSAIKYLQRMLKGFAQCKEKICSVEESKEKKFNIEKGSVSELKKKLDENNNADDANIEKERVESISSMIRRVVIYNTNKLTEKDVVLIDSPGLGSNFMRHTSITEKVLFEADTIVMITKPDYKFTPIDKSFLRSYETKVIRQYRENNIVFVLNKIGTIPENQSTPQKEADKLKSMIEEFGLKNVKIFKTDAERAMWAKLIKNGKGLSKEEKQAFNRSALMDEDGEIIKDIEANLESSGIPEFEQSISESLFEIKIRKSLSNKYERMECIIKDFKTDVEDKINSLEKTEKNLKIELKDIYDKRKAVETIMIGFFVGFNGEIERKVYSDKKEQVSKLVNSINDIFINGMDAIMSINKYYEFIDSYNKTPPGLVKKVLIYCEKDINQALHDMRKIFEKRYIDLRRHSIETEIPNLLKTYEIEDQMTLNIITNMTKSSVDESLFEDAINDLFSLRWFDKILVGLILVLSPLILVGMGLKKIFGKKKTEEEKEQDKIQHLNEVRKEFINKFKSLLSEEKSKIKDELEKNAFSWIDKDAKDFQNNTNSIINHIFDKLENSVHDKLNNLKLTKTERGKLKEKFEVFVSKTNTILASEVMRELRLNIESLMESENPTQP